MSLEDNKALVRCFWEAPSKEGFTRRIQEAPNPEAEREKLLNALFDETFVADYIQHNPEGDIPLESLKQYNIMTFAAFADIGFAVEDILAEGDKVAMRFTMRATHKGMFMGIQPTGKQVVSTGAAIYRVTSGKIAEGWGFRDRMSLMQQFGASPPARLSAT